MPVKCVDHRISKVNNRKEKPIVHLLIRLNFFSQFCFMTHHFFAMLIERGRRLHRYPNSQDYAAPHHRHPRLAPTADVMMMMIAGAVLASRRKVSHDSVSDHNTTNNNNKKTHEFWLHDVSAGGFTYGETADRTILLLRRLNIHAKHVQSFRSISLYWMANSFRFGRGLVRYYFASGYEIRNTFHFIITHLPQVFVLIIMNHDDKYVQSFAFALSGRCIE